MYCTYIRETEGVLKYISLIFCTNTQIFLEFYGKYRHHIHSNPVIAADPNLPRRQIFPGAPEGFRQFLHGRLARHADR